MDDTLRGMPIEVVHDDPGLARLEFDTEYRHSLQPQVVRRLRYCMQILRAAEDDRDLRALGSLHYEKLQGDRKHQRSIRVTRALRLILEVESIPGSGQRIRVIALEDYH